MHFKNLDLNLLVTLDVLLRERSITRAGDRLCLSQPATSGALARLREFFNDPLLVRVGRQLMLTPLAQSLVEPVSDVLQRVNAVVTTKAQFDPTESVRRFSIMASDYAFTIFMPAVLRRAETEAPRVSFELRQLSPDWHEELNRGDVDFVIIPSAFSHPEHPSVSIFGDGFSCVAWTGNAHVGRSLSLEQYLELGHVMVTLTGVQEASFDEWYMQKLGHVRRREVVAPTFALVPQLVVHTNRIATIWTRLAHTARRQLPLKLLPCPIDIPRFDEVLQWPAYREPDAGSLWLRHLVVDTATQMTDGPDRAGAGAPQTA